MEIKAVYNQGNLAKTLIFFSDDQFETLLRQNFKMD